jgi:effector-binding domain-containing protein
MSLLNAYESAFPKTPPNALEIKIIPASKVIISQTNDDYFANGNNLFMPLFRYIQSNDIAMTTPVEAEINPGAMYFYIGGDAALRQLESSDSVKVKQLPARTVASIGIKGSYSESNFLKAKARLEAWIDEQGNYTITGPARAIYWNGPFTPGLLKRSEVHFPVKKTD